MDLPDGETAKFLDPHRPEESSSPGDPVSGVVRYSYRIGEDKSLSIVKETIDATHAIDGTWADVTITSKHPEVEAYYPPGQWTRVRATD